MRIVYSFFWTLALPFAFARLWWRGRQESGYRQHWLERLGHYAAEQKQASRVIWVHAVSAGETRAAEPLVRRLLAEYPDHAILLTHMTAIGRSTAATLFADVNRRVTSVFLPYDLGRLMHRFIRHFQPECCLLMETEVWPNLLHSCDAARVPVALVNARLSVRSTRKAARLASLILPAAHTIKAVAAQSRPDAKRLQALGVVTPSICGNMKFDVTPPPQAKERGLRWRAAFGDRPVLICASTRDGEEAMILDALAEYLPLANQAPLVIIAPRHPQRFEHVANLLTEKKFRFIRRTQFAPEANPVISPDIQVILGDSMGEMYQYYAASDLAFIGGSLQALGGHNLIEACAMAKPVLIGPHTFNFSEISEQALAADAALRIDGARDLFLAVDYLFAHPQRLQQMGTKAEQFFHLHQGATERTMEVVRPLLHA